MSIAFPFTLDGATHLVTIRARRPALVVEVDGRCYTVREQAAPGDGDTRLSIDGREHRVCRARESDRVHVKLDHTSFSVGYQDPVTAAQHEAGGDDVLRADMPGVVVSVNAAPGASVASGDVLLVIESMKMQINVVAHRDGSVETVHVEVNQNFDKGAELVSLHPSN
ncbi:MAG: biotin/lipoyl-containing protein [Gammaproteobacteria bacterium]